ncbi:hypothetical protein OPV22_002701 [Ensete ventricosum]|uniref:Uncharacterized protein n=1 Tax=Ensete ventricosum TaxID=4639 RepID=A0AAV8RYJ9_ENSVE|nr:hypothetical protein OPV22_002701 [Ensete ventricosum]
MGPVKEAMEDAGLEKHRIDDIVVNDGITSIHNVQQLLKEFLIKWNPKSEKLLMLMPMVLRSKVVILTSLLKHPSGKGANLHCEGQSVPFLLSQQDEKRKHKQNTY